MNKRQTDKTNSYATLKITLEHPDNKPVWSALPDDWSRRSYRDGRRIAGFAANM